MKKIFIFAIAVMAMCATFSCGNKTAGAASESCGLNVAEAVGHGCNDDFGRAVVVTFKK